MSRAALALAFALSACVGLRVGGDTDCEAVCAKLSSCGFLPSALGWSEQGDVAAAAANCERRCGGSPADDTAVAEILRCVDEPSADAAAWCDADGSQWETCAAIDRCFDEKFKRGDLVGRATLTVQLVPFDTHDLVFAEEGGVAGLYGEHSSEIRSCLPALCDAQGCTEDADEATSACDTRLCGRERRPPRESCRDLGALHIEVTVRADAHPPVTQSAKIGSDEAPDCAAEIVFEAVDQRIDPGPVELSARVYGLLPPAELELLGYPPLLADPAEYCLLFSGPRLLVHAGSNVAALPIGDVEEIVAAGLGDGAGPVDCAAANQ
jgi:hypothetical protein